MLHYVFHRGNVLLSKRNRGKTMSSVSKIKSGEYHYQNGEVNLRIKKDFYMGGWNIWNFELGAPAFAMGFQSKKDAVNFLDTNLG